MPVPSAFTDLSETASSNSPAGSETVGTQANEYFQAAFSFIRQLYDGVLKPIAALNFNGQKITNVAAGSTSSTSTDVLTGAQVRALAYKGNEIRMWSGAVSLIPSVWGAGWQLADGTNGTPDLRDKFVIGAGFSYNPGTSGGSNTQTLSLANLPAHNHGVNDPSHNHGHSDPGHAHTINDPGHNHVIHGANTTGGGANTFNGLSAAVTIGTDNSATGITINGASTNVSNLASTTGITTQNAGSGAAFDNRPLCFALCFLCYTGAGA